MTTRNNHQISGPGMQGITEASACKVTVYFTQLTWPLQSSISSLYLSTKVDQITMLSSCQLWNIMIMNTCTAKLITQTYPSECLRLWQQPQKRRYQWWEETHQRFRHPSQTPGCSSLLHVCPDHRQWQQQYWNGQKWVSLLNKRQFILFTTRGRPHSNNKSKTSIIIQ